MINTTRVHYEYSPFLPLTRFQCNQVTLSASEFQLGACTETSEIPAKYIYKFKRSHLVTRCLEQHWEISSTVHIIINKKFS